MYKIVVESPGEGDKVLIGTPINWALACGGADRQQIQKKGAYIAQYRHRSMKRLLFLTSSTRYSWCSMTLITLCIYLSTLAQLYD